MAMQEAREVFGKMLRWSESPKDAKQAEETIYKGPVIQGWYIGKREGVGANASTVYQLILASGERVDFWGSELLDGKFANIPMNCEVRVTCLGTQQPKKAGGRAYLGFTVEFDKDSFKPANLVEAGTVPVAAPVAAAPVATPVAPAYTAPAAPAPYVAPVATSGAPAAAPVAGTGDGF